MTREEAIWAMRFYKEKLYNGIFNKHIEAFDVAIAALREHPVVHGRWEPHYEHDFVSDEDVLCGLHCSLCGLYYVKRHNYCPNCGARMDGDGND